jgi:hypothetical protein
MVFTDAIGAAADIGWLAGIMFADGRQRSSRGSSIGRTDEVERRSRGARFDPAEKNQRFMTPPFRGWEKHGEEPGCALGNDAVAVEPFVRTAEGVFHL